ncbi:hypothetical protein TREMEDRAFT_60738 [Tremella mesenterica DSM 1558]|uniref:uncharacterized protein n=1 Tax=Tremella mesenterica (strain ATCC 24925 / CBS 8224 / DSM 1558 / NBRC 9311 / NRRL Y-6157 / RJB 2259-6 / UBC 559-6) TaxID=578456 RepID=UPI0003F4A361|nr:uncharacterized protein TREMEDRAFT_60738 [Tremella mesenterica DSM 1558]EIW71820.1 hypothetical protein TREMEDRAFT_60738 [Tremella mesenterica DSM 1558]
MTLNRQQPEIVKDPWELRSLSTLFFPNFANALRSARDPELRPRRKELCLMGKDNVTWRRVTTSHISFLSPDGIIDFSTELMAEDGVAASTKEMLVPLEQATMVIAANRGELLWAPTKRTKMTKGDGGGGGTGTTKAPGTTGDGERRSTAGGARAERGTRGGGDSDSSHKGAGGQTGRMVTDGGRGGGRPGSSSDNEGDSVANTERPAAGGEGREVVESFRCLAGEGGRKEQTPDVHDAQRVPRLRSHSSPLGASSHLSGWAARRANRLAEVLTVPERGTGEEDGASTRTRFRMGVGNDWAADKEEETDMGDEVRRCLFLGDQRIEVFFFELTSFEGVFLLAGVEDGPATASGAAEDDEDADKDGRAAEREERRDQPSWRGGERRTKGEQEAGIGPGTLTSAI